MKPLNVMKSRLSSLVIASSVCFNPLGSGTIHKSRGIIQHPGNSWHYKLWIAGVEKWNADRYALRPCWISRAGPAHFRRRARSSSAFESVHAMDELPATVSAPWYVWIYTLFSEHLTPSNLYPSSSRMACYIECWSSYVTAACCSYSIRQSRVQLVHPTSS
jgi:hypothetical protein